MGRATADERAAEIRRVLSEARAAATKVARMRSATASARSSGPTPALSPATGAGLSPTAEATASPASAAGSATGKSQDGGSGEHAGAAARATPSATRPALQDFDLYRTYEREATAAFAQRGAPALASSVSALAQLSNELGAMRGLLTGVPQPLQRPPTFEDLPSVLFASLNGGSSHGSWRHPPSAPPSLPALSPLPSPPMGAARGAPWGGAPGWHDPDPPDAPAAAGALDGDAPEEALALSLGALADLFSPAVEQEIAQLHALFRQVHGTEAGPRQIAAFSTAVLGVDISPVLAARAAAGRAAAAPRGPLPARGSPHDSRQGSQPPQPPPRRMRSPPDDLPPPPPPPPPPAAAPPALAARTDHAAPSPAPGRSPELPAPAAPARASPPAPGGEGGGATFASPRERLSPPGDAAAPRAQGQQGPRAAARARAAVAEAPPQEVALEQAGAAEVAAIAARLAEDADPPSPDGARARRARGAPPPLRRLCIRGLSRAAAPSLPPRAPPRVRAGV